MAIRATNALLSGLVWMTRSADNASSAKGSKALRHDVILQVARDLARNIGDNVKVIGFDDSNTEARFSEL